MKGSSNQEKKNLDDNQEETNLRKKYHLGSMANQTKSTKFLDNINEGYKTSRDHRPESKKV